MKPRTLMLVVVSTVLLNAGILYAANGDLIVNGNLGVGTSTPTSKEEVNGTLTVDGNLTVGGTVNGSKISPTPAANAIPVSGSDNFLSSGWGVRLERLNYTFGHNIFTKSDTCSTNYTVGPTGSGANKIWTDLDNVPVGARYAVINATAFTNHSSDAIASCGSFATFMYNDSNNYVYGGVAAMANLQNEVAYDQATIFVPLDPNRIFKVNWSCNTTTNSLNQIKMTAVGYIK